MTDFVTLACPSCGAALHISPNTTSLKCDYCGNAHVVRRQGREISIENINAWPCPQCGTISTVGTGYCPKCGFNLARSCPNCNQRIYRDVEYCPECGVNISEKEQQLLEKQVTNQQRREQISQELELLEKEISQTRINKPKMPGVLTIFILIWAGVGLGIYAIGSQKGQQTSAIFCISSIALFVLVFIIIRIRNNKYQEFSRIVESYENRRRRALKLRDELSRMDQIT